MISYAEVSNKSLTLCHVMAIIAAIAAPISTAITSVALIAFLIFWLFSGQVLQTLKQAFNNPVGKTILVFFVWLIVGMLYAETDLSSKLSTLYSWQKLLFLFLLLGFFYEAQWQKRFVQCFVIGMSIACIISLLLWALGLAVLEQEPGIIMTNHTSQSMAFIAAVLCCMFLAKQPENAKYKYYLWLASGLFLFHIFFINPARSGFLALPPAILFAGIAIYGHKKLPYILGILLGIMLVAVLSSSNVQQRIKLALDEKNSYQSSSDETSIGIRMIFYKNSLELIKESPIFGYGTSSFGKIYSALAATKHQDWRGAKGTDPHNQYLFIWVENGAIGLLLFFTYIFSALRQGLRNKPYGPIAACFLVAVCASSLFNSHFKTFAEGTLLAFFLGALLANPPAAAPCKLTDHA